MDLKTNIYPVKNGKPFTTTTDKGFSVAEKAKYLESIDRFTSGIDSSNGVACGLHKLREIDYANYTVKVNGKEITNGQELFVESLHSELIFGEVVIETKLKEQ